MTVFAHLKQLETKHAQLESQIHEESIHPLPDFMQITALKKQKLHVKEEIARLSGDVLVKRQAAS